MADEQANTQSSSDSSGNNVSQAMSQFGTQPTQPTVPVEQSDNTEAGEGTSQKPEEKIFGKFDSLEEAEKSYKQLEQQFHTERQQPEPAQQIQTQVQQPVAPLDPIKFLPQTKQEEGGMGIYPATDQMLGRTVDKRLQVFGQQIAEQLNPVIRQLQEQVGQVTQQANIGENRAIAATVAQEFPELSNNKEFREQVTAKMKETQDELGVNLSNPQSFNQLLRLSCEAVKGKMSYEQGKIDGAENEQAGQLASKAMRTGVSGGKSELSDAELIIQGIQNAGKKSDGSIF